MKNMIRMVFVFCCFFTIAHAQLPKASDYFPLQVGNVWQYEPLGSWDAWQEEVIGDTLLGDTLLVYKVRAKLIPSDDPDPNTASKYYNYNLDSTVVYEHDVPDEYHDFRKDPYDALVLIDTRYGLDGRWEWLMGDYPAMFAVTDTGRANLYGRTRQWADVSDIVFEGDSIIVNGLLVRLVTGIGITERGGGYTLRYAKINGVEYGMPLSVQEEKGTTLPDRFTLRVYPNPVHGKANIQLVGEINRHVEITVYDILGRQVRKIAIDQSAPGSLTAIWDGLDQRGARPPSGIYFITATSQNQMKTQKIVYLRNGWR